MANPFAQLLMMNPTMGAALGRLMPGQNTPFGIPSAGAPQPYQQRTRPGNLVPQMRLSQQEQRIADYHRNSIETGQVGSGPNGEPVTVYSTGIKIMDGPHKGKFVSVPGWVNGRILNEGEAYRHWKKEIDAGLWPMYGSGEELNKRSREIHTIMDAEEKEARRARGER